MNEWRRDNIVFEPSYAPNVHFGHLLELCATAFLHEHSNLI